MTRAIGLLSTSIVLCTLAPLTAAAQSAGELTVSAAEIVDIRKLDLKAKSSDESNRPRFSPDKAGLTLTIEIQGAAAGKASHYGMLEIESAKDDKGGSIQLDADALYFHDPRKEYVKIDRDQMFFGMDNPPKDLLRIDLPFENPARAASTLSVHGKLMLKTVQTEDVVIADVMKKPGEIANDRLKELGVELKVEAPAADPDMGGTSFKYELSGKTEAVYDVMLVTAGGEKIETHGGSTMKMGGTESHEVWYEKAPPADAKLKLLVIAKSDEVAVPIELKDVKLP